MKSVRKIPDIKRRAHVFTQSIRSVKKARHGARSLSLSLSRAIRARHSAGINMFEKLSGHVKARLSADGKTYVPHSDMYLKSEQISITGIRTSQRRKSKYVE